MRDLFGHEIVDADKWTTLWSAKTDEWPTDWAVVHDWQERLGAAFALDVAATRENAKACKFYSVKDDALHQDWTADAGGEPIWCNPPYSDIDRFFAKALREVAKGAVIVMLLPSRTDRPWFHLAMVRRDVCTIHFARGRLRFGDAEHDAPFPSVVFVLRKDGR